MSEKTGSHRRIGAIAVVFLSTIVGAAQPPQSQPPLQPQQQPPQQQPPQQPRFRSEANLVRVDIFATRAGVPVQDLTAADFEVYEDGSAQKIDSFEHILIRPSGGEAERVEPNSVRDANEQAADAHRRVFVVYLDTRTTGVQGSHDIKEPLIELLTRIMSADDLVGVMTPDMSASQITFGRRTQVIEEGLRSNWAWGMRDTILLDPEEKKLDYCYPPLAPGEQSPSALAWALIDRRRERIVLDSLHDLVRHLRAIREGRSAVLTISEGWPLYRPDSSLTTLRKDPQGNTEPVPGAPPPVGVGPGGTLVTTETHNNPYGASQYACDRDRMDLAMHDDERDFRDVLDEANRGNVSFYPIDPRGLPVFDSPTGPRPPLSPAADRAMLASRLDTLRVLAANTDGIALLNNNDLTAQVRRAADDLTSYYLIGYYSSNPKLDGRFRTIKVRVKRPGIEVRARKGYRAATEAEVATAQKALAAPVPEATVALNAALDALAREARRDEENPGRPARPASGTNDPVLYHRGPSTGNQLLPAAGRTFARSDRLRFEVPATADLQGWNGGLLDRTGKPLPVPVTTGERVDAGGQRWLTADLTLAPLAAGDYLVQLTMTRAGQQQKVLTGIRVTR